MLYYASREGLSFTIFSRVWRPAVAAGAMGIVLLLLGDAPLADRNEAQRAC